MGWFLWFLLIPLGFVMVDSLATKGTYGGIVYRWTTENYARATDSIYLRIFWNSLKLATLTALSCLVIGYPMAYVMATASPARALGAARAGGGPVLDQLRGARLRDQGALRRNGPGQPARAGAGLDP